MFLVLKANSLWEESEGSNDISMLAVWGFPGDGSDRFVIVSSVDWKLSIYNVRQNIVLKSSILEHYHNAFRIPK